MNFETHLDYRDSQAFVSQCELADASHSMIDHLSTLNTRAARFNPMARMAPLALQETDETAAVVASNLLVFTEGMSSQNKQDVMDSVLFATLVANKQFNPEKEREQWYALFNTVLAKVGWLSTRWTNARYRATQQTLTMEQVALEILASAVAASALPGPASAAMLGVAADALRSLAAQDKPLRLFERHVKNHNGADFRIGACAESADGTVNLAMGAVSFSANAQVTNVLFWEWNSVEVQTYRAENSLTLNARLYARVRAQIQAKLGDSAQAAVEDFDI